MSIYLKPVALFISVILLLTCCSKLKSPQALLKDTNKRNEIMTLISDDSSLSSEMLDHLVLGIAGNNQLKKVTKSMLTKDFLMNTMEEDTVLANEMLCNIMEIANKNQLLCRQVKKAIEKYNLMEGFGLDSLSGFYMRKDKMQVSKKFIIPPQKSN